MYPIFKFESEKWCGLREILDEPRQHLLPSLALLGHEVGRVVGAAGGLVVDAGVELPHLEEVEGRLVDAVVGKRLPCRGDCGVRGLPVPGQDPGELGANSIRLLFWPKIATHFFFKICRSNFENDHSMTTKKFAPVLAEGLGRLLLSYRIATLAPEDAEYPGAGVYRRVRGVVRAEHEVVGRRVLGRGPAEEDHRERALARIGLRGEAADLLVLSRGVRAWGPIQLRKKIILSFGLRFSTIRKDSNVGSLHKSQIKMKFQAIFRASGQARINSIELGP